MRSLTAYKIAFIFLLLPLFANALEAGDKIVSKEFITESPTLVALGFEWMIGGDDNRAGSTQHPDRLRCVSKGRGAGSVRSPEAL